MMCGMATSPRRSGASALPRLLPALALAAALIGAVGAPAPAAASASSDDLPACTSMADWPTRPVTSSVRAAVAAYYRAKGLAPVAIAQHREYVLDVEEQRTGTHWCLNPDGSKSGYVGNVPKWATRAVMVYARHRPYPVTESPANFVTLAKAPGRPWKVVGEDTGP